MNAAEMTINRTVPADEMLAVRNPISGEVLAELPIMSPDAVRAAAERARAAQPAWEALGVKGRVKVMRRFADLMWEERERIIEIIRSETGKPTGGAWGEVSALDNTMHYYSVKAPKVLRPQKRKVTVPFAHRARVIYKPHGVAGFLTPWNYPLQNGLVDAIAALFAGNTILLKPSEVTPLSIMAAVALMHKAGIPQDVAQVLTGDGRTGAAMVDVVDYISLTGSTATGRKVAIRAAERMIPYSLELGGKDPAIVLEDADLDVAASWSLVGAFENAGQVCVSTERMYVLDAVYEPFMAKLQEWANKLTVSSESGFQVHMGSLTNMRELERTEAHLADAVERGAKVVIGGKRRPDLGPLFFEPTVLVDVTPDMAIMRDETFGPVMPIMRVKNVEEAIRQANNSDYGLSACIFTKNIKRGEKLAEQVESGDVTINHPMFLFGTPDLPMGGWKNSGVGRRNGPEGLLRFVKTHAIFSDNMLLTGPSLTQTDEKLRGFYGAQRRLRKVLPWL